MLCVLQILSFFNNYFSVAEKELSPLTNANLQLYNEHFGPYVHPLYSVSINDYIHKLKTCHYL